jgi:hypothetical protein
MSLNKLNRWFVITCAISLGLAGAAKLLTILILEAHQLDRPDFILPWLSLKQTMLSAAILELCVAYWLTFNANDDRALWLIAWLGSIFTIYRLSIPAPLLADHCPCLGVLGPRIPVSSHVLNKLLSYLALGMIGWPTIIAISRQIKKILRNMRFPIIARSSRKSALFMLAVTASFECVITPMESYAAMLTNQISISIQMHIEEFESNPIQATQNPNSFSFDVECSIMSNRWKIVSRFPRNAIETYYYDGTNVLVFTVPNEAQPDEDDQRNFRTFGVVPLLGAEGSYSNLYVTVIPGEHPIGNMGVNIPWMAFCSSHYLNMTNVNLPDPSEPVRHNLFAFGYETDVQRFPDGLALPKNVVWRTSKQRLLTSVNRPLLIRSARTAAQRAEPGRFVKHFGNGLLHGEYLVDESTNYCGINLPLKLRFQQYDRFLDQEPRIRRRVYGNVTSIEAASSIESPLNKSNILQISDLRFRDASRLIDAISYRVTNAVVPSTNDIAPQIAFQQAKARTINDPALANHSRSGLLIMFLAVLVIPPMLYASRRLIPKLHNHESAKEFPQTQ